MQFLDDKASFWDEWTEFRVKAQSIVWAESAKQEIGNWARLKALKFIVKSNSSENCKGAFQTWIGKLQSC
jgi:hypothetical protein